MIRKAQKSLPLRQNHISQGGSALLLCNNFGFALSAYKSSDMTPKGSHIYSLKFMTQLPTTPYGSHVCMGRMFVIDKQQYYHKHALSL
jgi:hypothetical protein